MALLDYLLRRRSKTAAVAKERLQIILAREHTDRTGPDYLPELKRDLLEVIAKYINVDLDQVKVNLDRDGNCDILELNIMLPEPAAKQQAMVK